MDFHTIDKCYLGYLVMFGIVFKVCGINCLLQGHTTFTVLSKRIHASYSFLNRNIVGEITTKICMYFLIELIFGTYVINEVYINFIPHLQICPKEFSCVILLFSRNIERGISTKICMYFLFEQIFGTYVVNAFKSIYPIQDCSNNKEIFQLKTGTAENRIFNCVICFHMAKLDFWLING